MNINRSLMVVYLALFAVRAFALSPEQVESSINDLTHSPYVLVDEAGKSVEGRSIISIIITDHEADPADKMRVLVISGQHGDEPAAPTGVLDLARELADGDSSEIVDLRQKVLFVLVPVVNPDGLAKGTRKNASGVDLNRDWLRQTQPEVKAVVKLNEVWKPELVLDEHEWLDGDAGEDEFIEACSTAGEKIRDKTLSYPLFAGFKGIVSRPGAARALAHRYMGSQGSLGFLIETHRKGGSLHIYKQVSLTLVSEALKIRGDKGFRSGSWQVPDILAAKVNRTISFEINKKPAGNIVIPLTLLAGYILMIAVLRAPVVKCSERKMPVIIRMSKAVPRREHDIIYWMSRQTIGTRPYTRRYTS